MVYKWNECSTEFFKEVFRNYWLGREGTKDKILELQSVDSLLLDRSDGRSYYGYGISMIDWEEYNKPVLDSIRKFGNEVFNRIISREAMKKCFLTDKGPIIVPIGQEELFKLLESVLFGDYSYNPTDLLGTGIKFNTNLPDINSWYIKDPETGKIIPGRKKYSSNPEKFVRVRVIDLDTWKNMINNYLKTLDPVYLDISEDLKRSTLKTL